MRFFRIIVLILTALLQSTPPAAPAEKALDDFNGYTIRKIVVVRENIFDLTDPNESGGLGRVGNTIHITTKENVIRSELLFKEGDRFDHLAMEESERNLRKYDYLTEVWISTVPDHENKTVDITVHTRDQWSLILGATFGGTDENMEFGIDFGEKNLLGSGQTLNYRLRSSRFGATHSFGFKDSTIFDSRYIFDVNYDTTGKENKTELEFKKPFFSLLTKTAHGIGFKYDEREDPELVHNTRRSRAFYGWSSGFWDDDILRTSLIFSYGELEYRKTGQPSIMERDNKALLDFEFLFNPHDFEQETYIEKFRQVEDIAMGPKIGISLGKRFMGLGATSPDLTGGIRVEKNFKLRQRDYFFASLEARSNDDNFNERYYEVELQYFWRSFKWQTFVVHVNAISFESEIHRMYLGGIEGLRGYKTDEFKGKGRVIINIEDRIFTYKSMFYGIIEPGFVIFNDWGNTWNDYSDHKLTGLHGSAGIGLRLALLKAPGISLVRVDYGYPITRSSLPVITIGMEGFF